MSLKHLEKRAQTCIFPRYCMEDVVLSLCKSTAPSWPHQPLSCANLKIDLFIAPPKHLTGKNSKLYHVKISAIGHINPYNVYENLEIDLFIAPH